MTWRQKFPRIFFCVGLTRVKKKDAQISFSYFGMKAFVFLVLLTLSCAWDPSPTRPKCEGVPFFGPYASHFNTFVFEDFVGKNSDTEGRLFAGGNINIKSWAVGCRVYTTSNCINFGSVTCGDIAGKSYLLSF